MIDNTRVIFVRREGSGGGRGGRLRGAWEYRLYSELKTLATKKIGKEIKWCVLLYFAAFDKICFIALTSLK